MNKLFPPDIGTKVSKSRLGKSTGCWGVEVFRSACPVTNCSRDTRTLLVVSRSCADLRTSRSPAPARRYARQRGRGLGGENDAPLHGTFLGTAGRRDSVTSVWTVGRDNSVLQFDINIQSYNIQFSGFMDVCCPKLQLVKFLRVAGV